MQKQKTKIQLKKKNHQKVEVYNQKTISIFHKEIYFLSKVSNNNNVCGINLTECFGDTFPCQTST